MHYGTGSSGRVAEALRGITNPKLLIMTSPADYFEENVAELEKAFPGVPSIGCIAMGYEKQVEEKGVTVTAFTEGVSCAVGVLEKVSKAPARNISRLQEDLSRIRPGSSDTAIIDFCSGNDAGVLNTLNLLINKYNLQLMGATGDAGKLIPAGMILR